MRRQRILEHTFCRGSSVEVRVMRFLLITFISAVFFLIASAALAEPRREDPDGGGSGYTDSDGDGVHDQHDCDPFDASIGNPALAYGDADFDDVADSSQADLVSCTNGGLPLGVTLNPNYPDNCPAIANTAQNDLDGDLVGDACDVDLDGDRVLNDTDCAPSDAALSIASVFPDSDRDGVRNSAIAQGGCYGFTTVPAGYTASAIGLDNCGAIANTDQADSDSDGIGDSCEPAIAPAPISVNFCSISGSGATSIPLQTQSRALTRLALIDMHGQTQARAEYAGQDLLAVGDFFEGSERVSALSSFGVLDLARKGQIDSAGGTVINPFSQIRRARGAACRFEKDGLASFVTIEKGALKVRETGGSASTLAVFKGQRLLKVLCADLERDGSDDLVVLSARSGSAKNKRGKGIRAQISVLSRAGALIASWKEKIWKRKNPVLAAADVDGITGAEVCVLARQGTRAKPSGLVCSSGAGKTQINVSGTVLDLAAGKFEGADTADLIAVLVRNGKRAQPMIQFLSEGRPSGALELPAELGWTAAQLDKARFASCR